MATPPPDSLGFENPANDTVMSDPQQYTPNLADDQPVEEEAYREIRSIQCLPTKTGEEETMQLNSDRPGSAGTINSCGIGEDEEQFLQSMSASKKPEAHSIASPPLTGSFFSRPDGAREAETSPSFTFGTHNQQHMDFQEMRKKPSVSMSAGWPKPGQPEREVTAADQDNDMHPHTDFLHTAERRHIDEAAEVATEMQARAHHRSKTTPSRKFVFDGRALSRPEKGRRKKASRQHCLPEEQSAEAETPLAENSLTTPETAHPHQSASDHIQDTFHDTAGEFHPMEEVRPQTPDQSALDCEQHQASSPNDQLQGDLETSVEQNAYPQQKQELATEHPYGQCSENRDAAQPPHSYSAPSFTQAATDSHDNECEPVGPRSVNARKSSKSSRKASTSARPAPIADANPDSEINYHMQMLIYNIRQQSHQALRRLTAERDDTQGELQQLQAAMQSLQDDLANVHKDKDNLTSTCDKQKTKLASYETRAKKLKIFVDGLGHDVDSLKREANATRRKSEQLVQEGLESKAERAALLQQINDCAERSTQVKNEALNACLEAQTKLKDTATLASHLDEKLSENAGLLVEERDRCAQLERRLLSASNSSENILRTIRTDNDALLEKLHAMHATVQDTDASTKISSLLGQVLEAVQAVSMRTETSADDAASARGLIEAMSDRLSEVQAHATTEALKKQLDHILAGLKGLAEHQEDRVRQDTLHREAIDTLHEGLKQSSGRLVKAEEALQLAQAREGTLKDEIQKLQTKITATPAQPTSAYSAPGQLDDIKAELRAKTEALESARSHLTSKTIEFDSMKKANQELDVTMQRFRHKIDELEQARNELVPERQAVEDRIRKEVERERTELQTCSDTYRAQLEMESKNQMRKLTSDRDRFEKQVTTLKTELASSKKHLEELQNHFADAEPTSEQLEQAKKLTISQTKEIETLKSSLRDLRLSADGDALLREKLATMSEELDNKRKRLQEAVDEKMAILKKADEYLHNMQKANETSEQAKTDLVTCRADLEFKVDKLNQAVNAAQEAKSRAEAGQEHFRKSCDKAVADEAAKGRKQLQDLQLELDKAKAEESREKAAGNSFRADVEEEWKRMDADHAQKLEDLRGQIEEAEVAKEAALANTERSIEERTTLLEQIDALKRRLVSAEEKLQRQQESQGENIETISRLQVPSLSQGITPSGSERTTEPARPRKKVDRNFNSTHDSSALPVPEVLRPDCRRAESSNSNQVIQEPVIADFQVVDSQGTGHASRQQEDGGRSNFAMFSDADDDSQLDQRSQSRAPTQKVEETQFDSLPSFAALTRNHSTQNIAGLSQMSSSLSMAYDNGYERAVVGPRGAAPAAPKPLVAQRGVDYNAHAADANFSVYEDGEDVENKAVEAVNTTSSVYPQGSFHWSQEERDKYTFRKKMPEPNSASKLVREGSQVSTGGKRRASGLSERAPLRERRFETPEVRGEAARSSHSSVSNSSSPAYVQPASTRRSIRTYSNVPGGSAKRQTSTQPSASQDPRLVGRNPSQAPKRKADTHITEGYEQERKKRLNATASVPSSSQQSIRDLPTFPAMPANPKGSSIQTRLRTLGGGSSRAPASKQVSRNNSMNNRFSQELGRR